MDAKSRDEQMQARAADVEAERPSDRPVDLVHLSKYTLGSRSLEAELLGIFRTQAGVYLERLEKAAAQDKEWRDAAHSLKGSARSLGAWTLGLHAEHAEKLERKEARPAALDLIRTEIAIVTRFIDELNAS